MDNILNSIVNSKKIDLLDVIVVDDGSKDRTAELANKFAKEYSDSISVISKKNGGHGSTINVGIQYAVGTYFKVVDADDWLSSKNLDLFVGALMQTQSDLVFNPFWIYDDKFKKKRLKNVKPQEIPWREERLMSKDELNHLPSIHSYTIKTSILRDNKISIDEHAYYVDVEYILYPLPYVKTYEFIDIPVYFYRVNQSSQSISVENMKKNKVQHEIVLRKVNHYVNKMIDSGYGPENLIVVRLSEMIAAQLKIISLGGVSRETRNELRLFYKWAKQNTRFNEKCVNLPIRFLIKSNFRALVVIHFLAIIKMKVVHI